MNLNLNLNHLLSIKDIDPEVVLVLRHSPREPKLRKFLRAIAGEHPDLFDAYQQTQNARLENVMHSMVGAGYVASFIGHEPGRAVFVGLYSIKGEHRLTREQFWRIESHVRLQKNYGMQGYRKEDPRPFVYRFHMELTEFCASWKGKVIVTWPRPERSWWRRAHRNDMAIEAVAEESLLDAPMPEWNRLLLTGDELRIVPRSWTVAIAQGRCIYYIFDGSDRKGYVGSAYGRDNLLGRWRNYAARGHGGNHLLMQRDPRSLRFSILELVRPDMDKEGVIQLESSWKDRLHTRAPEGLNDN